MAAKARILAVDDQLYFRTHLEEILGSAGFEVRTAGGGAEALRVLEEEAAFDLVLTDLVMPEMDGVETVERIRERWPEQEVIVITAVGDVRSAVAAMRRGAADYLLKPIDPEGLVEAIQTVLSRRRLQSEHARLVSENLEFMSQVSLYERATALFSLEGSEQVAERLIELLCVEARGRGGWVWRRDPAADRWEPAGERPAPQSGPAPDVRDAPLDQLESGPAIQADADRILVWVPLRRDEALLGLACIVAPPESPLGASEQAACARLGTLGALALARLPAPLESPPASSDSPPVAVDVGAAVGEPSASALRDPETRLATLDFLVEIARLEIHKAQRFGRNLGLLCVDWERESSDDAEASGVGAAISGCLRSTDVLAREPSGPFWVLIAEPDALGGVVLKRRIAGRVTEETGVDVAVGLASFQNEGSTIDALLDAARWHTEEDRRSLARELQLPAGAPLADISSRLLDRAEPVPAGLVAAAADLVISDLASRPGDRGLLFLAPGLERAAILGPLAGLGAVECATEVFVAVEGDTLPSGPSLHALPLPPDLDEEATWIVRFGEAPPYALVAGAERPDGTRPVFHVSDPALVEHLAFRLRAEVGFGMRM